MSYLTVPLHPSHNKKLFSCGKPLLDTYLHTQAKQDVNRKLSACFVLTNDENNSVKGYYTLSSAQLYRGLRFRTKLKKNFRPLIRIYQQYY